MKYHMENEPEVIKLGIPCPCCQEIRYTRLDFVYSDSMACCDWCGADFIIDADKNVEQITFNPYDK